LGALQVFCGSESVRFVVTTKKGRAGTTHWSWSGELGNVDDRTNYQPMYANWGHDPADASTQIRCQLGSMVTTANPGGDCVSDSLTHYNLLEDPSRTFVHMGHRKMGAVQVNGGSEAVRFFASGQIDDETGPIQMPQFEVDRFNSLHTSVRDEWFHPLAQQSSSFRTNLSASLSPKFDLNVNAGWSKTDNPSSRRAICSSRSTTWACRTTGSRVRDWTRRPRTSTARRSTTTCSTRRATSCSS
jgi:hypothetical protein